MYGTQTDPRLDMVEAMPSSGPRVRPGLHSSVSFQVENACLDSCIVVGNGYQGRWLYLQMGLWGGDELTLDCFEGWIIKDC